MSEERTAIMSTRALPAGYEILWYTIKEVLGQGGFGITYLAHDINLDRWVAIKEYLPTPFAYRRENFTVKPLTDNHSDNYAWGLESFLKEAQTLAKFGHDNIVRVHSVFENNNTAYMVMEYEHGENLASIYKSRAGKLDQSFFEHAFFPIFDGLKQIHTFGFIHRDIKPANIYIREDGTPVLIDFGSARQTSQQQTGEMTTLVSKGYTPLEQYSANYGDQGPWTDIYALAATLYEGVTGCKPDESLSRSACMLRRKPDLVQRLAVNKYPAFEQQFLDATVNGLSLEPEARPADLVTWLRQFKQSGSMDSSLVTSLTAVATRHPPPATSRRGFDQDTALKLPKRNRSSAHNVHGESADFDFTDDDYAPLGTRKSEMFDDDFVRPGTRDRSSYRTRSDAAKDKHRQKNKWTTGIVLGALLALGMSGGLVYYLTSHMRTDQDPLAVDMINQLPRPSEVVAIVLPKEQVVHELEDLSRLSEAFQRALSVDAANSEILAGVDGIYDDLSAYANQWHSTRHADISEKISNIAQSLPERNPQKETLLALLQTNTSLTTLDHVRGLLESGQIASPAGASVFDQVNRLSQSDYMTLSALPQWQSMKDTLSNSVAEKLQQGDFETVARIVEAALSLDPDDTGMERVRDHLR